MQIDSEHKMSREIEKDGNLLFENVLFNYERVSRIAVAAVKGVSDCGSRDKKCACVRPAGCSFRNFPSSRYLGRGGVSKGPRHYIVIFCLDFLLKSGLIRKNGVFL